VIAVKLLDEPSVCYLHECGSAKQSVVGNEKVTRSRGIFKHILRGGALEGSVHCRELQDFEFCPQAHLSAFMACSGTQRETSFVPCTEFLYEITCVSVATYNLMWAGIAQSV
jgi:hypothetical protein